MTAPALTEACSIQRTLDLVGNRWALLILRDVFRGVRRFSQIQSHLGIARNLLTDRLATLVAADVLVRVPYQEHPLRHEYHLTPKGRDLSAALIALMRWGDRWTSADGPPTVLVHDECGEPLEQLLRCQKCRASVTPAHIRSRPGPGRPDPVELARAAT